jgi:ATP-dependent Lon protease
MSDNSHQMTTRSKAKNDINENYEPSDILTDDMLTDDSSVDENGNLKGFIDYDCDDDFDHKEFDKQLNRLKGVKPKRKKKRKNKKQKQNDKKLNEVFMTYLIMKATEKANLELKKNRKQKKRKNSVKVEVSDDDSESVEQIVLDEPSTPETHKKNLNTILTLDFSTDSDDTSFKGSDNKSDISLDSISENSSDETVSENVSESSTPKKEIIKKDISEESTDKLSSEDSDEEYSFEYDENDEKYEELIDKQMLKNSEEANMEYYHYLEKEKKDEIYNLTKEIYEYNGSNKPLRFKVIESHMDMKTKAIALENIDKMSEMDVSTGEHSKMDHWINGLMRIPFGKYNNISVNPGSSIHEKREFIQNTYKTLDKSIYGHKEAKTHILQVIGKWMKNPDSGGNVLAIQGPMGNGKTTLVKEGISKVLNRPFHFIALGGASDSAYFDGHCYTYEGSHWGRIVQILQESKCMNPVIYFDELDKISDTTKGDEITHMLTHLTDPSQNSLFQDNYFPGVNLDLSKALFIFSYNDESKVNKILKDRMYVIHTKGFKTDDKIKICNEYLIPDIFSTFAFSKEEIIFSDEIIKNIIEKYTHGEEGVRNLKRCIETIVSKINIHILSDGDSGLSFQLKDISLPVLLNEEHIEILLKTDTKDDKPPCGMYL